MKEVLLIGLLACISFSCSNKADVNTSTNKTVSTAPDGQTIYKQYCLTCHGANGDLMAAGAKDLTVSALSLEERIKLLEEGKNAMPAYRQILGPERIEAVAKFTLSLKKATE